METKPVSDKQTRETGENCLIQRRMKQTERQTASTAKPSSDISFPGLSPS